MEKGKDLTPSKGLAPKGKPFLVSSSVSNNMNPTCISFCHFRYHLLLLVKHPNSSHRQIRFSEPNELCDKHLKMGVVHLCTNILVMLQRSMEGLTNRVEKVCIHHRIMICLKLKVLLNDIHILSLYMVGSLVPGMVLSLSQACR